MCNEKMRPLQTWIAWQQIMQLRNKAAIITAIPLRLVAVFISILSDWKLMVLLCDKVELFVSDTVRDVKADTSQCESPKMIHSAYRG